MDTSMTAIHGAAPMLLDPAFAIAAAHVEEIEEERQTLVRHAHAKGSHRALAEALFVVCSSRKEYRDRDVPVISYGLGRRQLDVQRICRSLLRRGGDMDRREIDALLERQREAFRQLDAVGLSATHAADGIFESPAHGKVIGRSAIEQIYRYWIAAFPDFVFEWREPIVEGDRVALFWSFAGTAKGPFFGVVSAGRRIDMVGAVEYRVAQDGIVHARHVFDFSGVLVQTGVLKVKSM